MGGKEVIRTTRLDVVSIGGFAIWFDVEFRGGGSHSITMSTGPENGYTHWGQYVLYLVDPIIVEPKNNDRVWGTFEMERLVSNPRMYNLRLKTKKHLSLKSCTTISTNPDEYEDRILDIELEQCEHVEECERQEHSMVELDQNC